MEPPIEVLEMNPVAATLMDGDTLRIQVLSKIGDGAATAPDPSNPVTWISSAPKVAVVAEGLIRGVGAGEARVTAISRSGAEAFADITVKQAPAPDTVSLTPPAADSVSQATPPADSVSQEPAEDSVSQEPAQDSVSQEPAEDSVSQEPAADSTSQAPPAADSTSQAPPATDTVTQAGPAPAAKMVAVSGGAQSGAPGEELGEPLVVKVTDASGEPVPGASVSWTVTEAGGTIAPVAETTDEQGNASAVWTLGQKEGEHTASAIVDEVESAAFSAMIKAVAPAGPGPAANVSAISGDAQSGKPGETLGEPLVVKVTDASGEPVPGVSVTWIVTDAGGTVEPVAAKTDEQGNASGLWTLGEWDGKHTASAIVDGAESAAFSAVIEKPSPPAIMPPYGSDGLLPAFPGAEGWGATALNECRAKPLQVIAVTNTATDGQGSLDQALKDARSDRFTFIVFRTGGTFNAQTAHLNASCVYIAGQTAPGDGFAVTGSGLWIRGSGDNISDIVLRHLRFRGGRTHINMSKGGRIVLDHLSSSHSDNHHLSILRYPWSWSDKVSDVSIQNTIMSEALAGHPTAFNIGAQNPHREDPTIGVTNLSIHRNLFAHNSHRNPASSADNALIANNVLYNWNQGTIQLRHRGLTDVINNYGKEGPMTMSGSSPNYRYMVNPSCEHDLAYVAHSMYVVGNTGPLSSDPNGDNWSGSTRQIACYYKEGGGPGAEVPGHWRRNSPQGWANVPFPVTLRTAAEAYSEVLRDAGANAAVRCDGEWVSSRDAVDTRVIGEVANRTGLSTPRTSASNPSYRAGSPCADNDNDGLPNAWETRFFGCSTCADPATVGRDGYWLMEHYVNGTDPR